MSTVEDVRLLIGDSGSPEHFSDAQLKQFLDLESDDVRMAAAAALDSWAASLAAEAHNVTIGGYREDTTAAVKAMGERAAALRSAAATAPAFAVAQTVPDHADQVAREWAVNAALRGEL